VVHPTFKAAWKAMSFLDNENEWIECIKEAAARATGIQLQQLFATILTHCEVAEPKVAMGVGLGGTLKRYPAQAKNKSKLSNIAVDCFLEESIYFDKNRETDETIRKVTKGLPSTCDIEELRK